MRIRLIMQKKLSRYYGIFHNIGYIINPNKIPMEEDKYEINYLCSYLGCFVDTAKRCIVGVIKALGNDEPLDPFLCLLICILQSK